MKRFSSILFLLFFATPLFAQDSIDVFIADQMKQQRIVREFVFHCVDGNEHKVVRDSTLSRFLKYLFNAFPDLHYSVDLAVAQGPDVALYLTATGTHKNEFHGFPASNNKVSFKEAFFFRISNSKITEGWGIVDLEGLKDQMKKK